MKIEKLLLLVAMIATAEAFLSPIIKAVPAFGKFKRISSNQEGTSRLVTDMVRVGYGGKAASSAEEDLALTIKIIQGHVEDDAQDLPLESQTGHEASNKRTKVKQLAKDIGKNLKDQASNVSKKVKTNVSSFVVGA